MRNLRGLRALATLALLMVLAVPVRAQEAAGKPDPDGLTLDYLQQVLPPEYFQQAGSTLGGDNGRVQPNDIPWVYGPGAVLTVGNVYMKVTNWGHVGNLFTNVSSDPGGQWPGSSAIEYLSSIRLMVGAVNPTASDPLSVRRVSYLLEWRPPSLAAEDKMYRAYDGIINGQRYSDDDGNQFDRLGYAYIDEDFLDGHDNDGDGKIDEDYGALGQMMWSCVMRDDTPQAIALVQAEKHVPLGLECKQLAWAYSIPGFTDFDVVQYTITNVSGHELDSLVIGWLIDCDAGPIAVSNYYADDFDLPYFPHGEFRYGLDSNDPRRQAVHDPQLDGVGGVSSGQPLCSNLKIRINGFSIADDDGDEGRTTGIPSFLLIDHTIDPLGTSGPWRVGFRSFRSFTSGTPYVQGGNPTIDQQRFEFMTGRENVDVSEEATDRFRTDGPTGWITSEPGDQKGDYVQLASVGPWYHVPPGGSVQATIAFAIKRGKYTDAVKYRLDYAAYELGQLSRDALTQKYPVLDNAIAAQTAFEGIYEVRNTYPSTTYHGKETPAIGDLGSLAEPVTEPACDNRGTESNTVLVDSNKYYWFDMDCDYCTGVYNYQLSQGLFHKVWNAEAPPPNPNTNTAVKYNYTDNPDRSVAAAGDRTITVAWDNLSEATPDPKSRWFDCRGYKLWKVANWTRPVGSPGPGEDDWALIGEFRLFSYRGTDGQFIRDNRFVNTDGDTVCPSIYIPNYLDPETNVRGPATVPICLQLGDLWDRQTGQIIRPTTMPCVLALDDTVCAREAGGRLGSQPLIPDTVTRFPVGRYRYVDTEVKNGFLYFYSVTAFDSTGSGTQIAELNSRRSAVEAEGVTPQTATRTGKSVWVVPNPYRGYSQISQRSSSWDLTPNSSDPTGTHIDFMGLPRGEWTIRIYTVSGDLVNIMRSTDGVNESIRPVITDDSGVSRPGYNRQQDTANDGQASWNLISRNGQDVVSGIYIFVVDSKEGTQRGKFVVIR
jgi:hypothetical protein